MEIQEVVGHRKQDVMHIGRDLACQRAVEIARKTAVEIQPVDRGGAGAGLDSPNVDGRDRDDASGNIARIDLAQKLAERDRTLIFIAVVAPSIRTVGPSPFLMTASGTRTVPQASSCGD